MKLYNAEAPFELLWDGKDFTIPKGHFEVTNNHLGYFIQETAKKWNKDVRIVDLEDSSVIKTEIKTQKEELIKKEPVATQEVEPVTEELTEKKKPGRPKKV